MIVVEQAMWYRNGFNPSEAQVKEAWASGKDFRIVPNGPYCSSRDTSMLLASFDTVVARTWDNGYISLAYDPLC